MASRCWTTSSAATLLDTNSTDLPSAMQWAIRFAIVCDLPVPGAPCSTKRRARGRRADRGELARVRVERREDVRRRARSGDRLRGRDRRLRERPSPGRLIDRREVRDDRMLEQRLAAPLEIGPQRVRGEREHAEPGATLDAPPGTRHREPFRRLEQPRELEGPIRGEHQIQVAPQLLDQHRIDARLDAARDHQPERRPALRALELDRPQRQRRAP